MTFLPFNLAMNRSRVIAFFLKYIVMRPVFALMLCASANANEVFEFEFWPAEGMAESDPRIVSFHEGPCGETASAQVTVMPEHSDQEVLAPEQVFELNSFGKVLRGWTIPVNAIPYALAGNDLLFSYGDMTYQVSLSRIIKRVQPKPEVRAPTALSCGIPQEFHESTYAGCWSYGDTTSDVQRILAFLGPCT